MDEEIGALASKRYLIIDRDAKYTRQFRRYVEEGGVEIIPLPDVAELERLRGAISFAQ